MALSRGLTTKEEWSKPVSYDHLHRIAMFYDRSWDLLPPLLGMEVKLGEQANFLYRWKSEHPPATYKQLITALQKVGCWDAAHEICEMLREGTKRGTLHNSSGISMGGGVLRVG